MTFAENKINPHALAWLETFSEELDADPDIIDVMPIENVREELRRMGADVGFHAKMKKTLDARVKDAKIDTDSLTEKLKETANQIFHYAIWILEGAGMPVTAADISEQEKTIKTDEGEIRITCVWGGETDDDPAYIWVKWDADMEPDAEFVILIVTPDNPPEVRYKIRPGKIREGSTTIESEKLKFNPTGMKWGIAVTKEYDEKN